MRIQVIAKCIDHARRNSRSCFAAIDHGVLEKFVHDLSVDKRSLSPIDWLTIVSSEHIEPQYLTPPGIVRSARAQFPDRHEIPQALAHLLAFHLQEAVVH